MLFSVTDFILDTMPASVALGLVGVVLAAVLVVFAV